MIKILHPTVYVKSVFEIDYNKLKRNKIKLLCFDLDNTLDKPDEVTIEIEPKIKKLIEELKKDFDIIITSNNRIKGRVSSFANQVELNYIESMNKPFLKKYKNEKILKYKKEEIIFIGDKIITDIVGANRYECKSILVDPKYPKSKKWYAYIMNLIDRVVGKISNIEKKKYFDEMSDNEL